jgi:hypothetical protein
MPLNLADRFAIRRVIVERSTAVVTNYALYILGNVAATTLQKAWAREAIRNPAAVGDAVSYYVLNQTPFLNNGSSITDAELTSAVESAINTHFIQAV